MLRGRVAATVDPRQKLEDAEVLFMSTNRTLPAEGLILEAIVIFQQRQDWQWLGHAYRDGFRDKDITFDNRLARAADFYRMALESYKKAEGANVAASQYDALTNLYLNMGLSSHQLGLVADACVYYAKMVEAAQNNRVLHPTTAPSQSSTDAMASAVRATALEARTPCRDAACYYYLTSLPCCSPSAGWGGYGFVRHS